MSEKEDKTVRFDADNPPKIELDDLEDDISIGLAKLAEMGVVDVDTEDRDGEEVVTRCSINMRYLSAMATEFHVVERRYGERWELGSWDPEIRVLSGGDHENEDAADSD